MFEQSGSIPMQQRGVHQLRQRVRLQRRLRRLFRRGHVQSQLHVRSRLLQLAKRAVFRLARLAAQSRTDAQ